MQRIAAYLLERTEGMDSPEARAAEGVRIRAVIESWLVSKGATTVEGAGTYAAVDGSDASLATQTAVDGDRSWSMFELTEVTDEGRKFVTTVSVTVGRARVFVFLTMGVGTVATSIMPIDVDARCPRVVRDLLAQGGRWWHGSWNLDGMSRVSSFEAGEDLADEILNPERTIPVVVISSIEGRPAIPRLHDSLARDLAGLANVHLVSEDASWALTDRLRKPLSTYGGAIRIYWPQTTLDDDPYSHPLWTAVRLQGIDDTPNGALERIRRQFRSILMRASAAGVVRPDEIGEIWGAAARAEYAALKAKASDLEELKAKASSLEEFQQLAELYAKDNDVLQHALAARDADIRRLQDENKDLVKDNKYLNYQIGLYKQANDDNVDVAPDAPEQDDSELPPIPGESRYYKKIYAKQGYDVLVPIQDCGHTAWQSSRGGDKARKGLERLLRNFPEWRNLWHCGSCTGGGVWRVDW